MSKKTEQYGRLGNRKVCVCGGGGGGGQMSLLVLMDGFPRSTADFTDTLSSKPTQDINMTGEPDLCSFSDISGITQMFSHISPVYTESVLFLSCSLLLSSV